MSDTLKLYHAISGLDVVCRSEPKLAHDGLEREFNFFQVVGRRRVHDVCTGRSKKI
jgi:hypothetical protein